MFEMDLSGLNHSPTLSEKAGSWSWALWGPENITDSNNELCGLVEDKEIAARAVAFVVNSTRKGIVPLCADVANLLRSKQSLEKKIRLLKRENDVLRSSASLSFRPSDSTSPTPASLSSHNSYTENCIKALQEAQDRYNRSSSRCSNCSSSLSYSPKIDKSQDHVSGMQHSPASSRESGKQGSSKSIHSLQSSFREVSEILQKGGVQFSTNVPRKKVDETVDEAICMDNEISISNDIPSQVRTSQSLNIGDGTVNDGSRGSCDSVQKGNSFETRVDVHICDNKDDDNKFEEINNEQFNFHIENEITKQIKLASETRTSKRTSVEAEANVRQGKSEHLEPLNKDHSKTDKSNGDGKSEAGKDIISSRRRSLPEVVCTPNPAAYKVNAKISKQTQCSLLYQPKGTLEDQFIKTVKTNTKLSEELSHARKEIDILRQRLKLLEDGKHQRGYNDDDVYAVNNDDDKNLEDNGYYTSSNKTTRQSSVNKKWSPKRVSTTPVSYTGPIPGCKCSSCQESLGSDDDLSHYSDQLVDEPARYAVNSKLVVQLDDHVVVKGDKSGTIRYIGHIDRNRQANVLYVGLELDTPGGKHDGYYLGKRYFLCGKERGLFVPLQDVICKGNKISKSVKQELSASGSSKSRKGHKKGQGSQEQNEKITEL